MPDDSVEAVLVALRRIRTVLVRSEYEVHAAVREELGREGLRFEHEVKLAPRQRVDFLVEGGVAIEVKKGKPNGPALASQVARYASSPRVTAIVMLVERNVADRPDAAHGKPVHYVSLSQNWGISL